MAGTEKSLRGQVFDKIRSDILNGKYKRGEELVESSIGKELGISRTPVREAIRQLELEGLVQLVPNKGAFVTGISEKDVRDIYLIRARLEGLAARMAAKMRWKRRLSYQNTMRKKNIMNRYVRWTVNFINFYIKHPEAGF